MRALLGSLLRVPQLGGPTPVRTPPALRTVLLTVLYPPEYGSQWCKQLTSSSLCVSDMSSGLEEELRTLLDGGAVPLPDKYDMAPESPEHLKLRDNVCYIVMGILVNDQVRTRHL